MEQKGEVGVNSAFAKLMTGQEQVMDLDKYPDTFIWSVKMGVVQVQRGAIEMGVVQLRVVQMEVDQSSHTVAHLK